MPRYVLPMSRAKEFRPKGDDAEKGFHSWVVNTSNFTVTVEAREDYGDLVEKGVLRRA